MVGEHFREPGLMGESSFLSLPGTIYIGATQIAKEKPAGQGKEDWSVRTERRSRAQVSLSKLIASIVCQFGSTNPWLVSWGGIAVFSGLTSG